MYSVDSVVIGAGVVGLAVARALAASGRSVLIVEHERNIGTGISSRNSEVVHAGLYYPPGSLKARLCVEGRRLLYDFCALRGVPIRRCGKLLIGSGAAQEAVLADVALAASRNGVDDLTPLTRARVALIEPAIRCTAGLFSPSTGIVDSHALMLSLLAAAEDDGATLALDTTITRIVPIGTGFAITVLGDDEPLLRTREVVNAGGLGAWSIAALVDGLPAVALPPRYLAKGSYFALTGRSPFSHLVYPVPEHGGLGVHLTLDLTGRARFGPDVEWCDAEAFDVDERRVERFYAAIRQYWPALPDGALVPAYAGIRPKISGRGDPAADFRIDGAERHGLDGLVNLFGIESPGLTASLALGIEVCRQLG